MVKYLRIFSYIRTSFLIYDFATNPIWISLYMRKISFPFLLVGAILPSSCMVTEGRVAIFILFLLCLKSQTYYLFYDVKGTFAI